MTNSEWVILHILWKGASSHLFHWPTDREWHCTFCERQSHHIFSYINSGWVTWDVFEMQSHHIFSYDQQIVSDIANFVKGSLITFFLWPTVCEWHCTSCDRQSHHIFSYDQQTVSDIAYFVRGSKFFSYDQQGVSDIACLWQAVSSYDQQEVSDIAHVVKGGLITSFPMMNSLWVTFHILWNAVSSYLLLWLTGSEWHCMFVKGCLITSFSMTNSESVTLHVLWKAFSSHLSLWATASECHCTLCEWQSHHIFFYDQKVVSDIAHCFLITSFPMTNSEWVTLHILWKALLSHLFLTNSEWVTLQILWKAHLFLWSTECEWFCTFRQSHQIFSYYQQQVSRCCTFCEK